MKAVLTGLSAALAGLILAGCETTSLADDPVYLRVQDLEARLIRIERVLDNDSLVQMATSLQQLQTEIQGLRGEVETLRFETDNAAERQRNLYLDLDQRLQALEQGPSQAAAGGVAQTVVAPNQSPAPAASGNDQTAYDAAFALIQTRRYDEAQAAFGGFLTLYADSPLADNAQYWLAETFYVRQQYVAALPEFQKVIDGYPQSAKFQDALLKIGYCHYELERWDAARDALDQVERQFPNTAAAQLATERLARLAQEAG